MSEGMDQESGAEFRFKPGRFGRHCFAGIGDCHHLLDGCRAHGECNGGISLGDILLESGCSANSSHEVDPGIDARILDIENRCQEIFLQACDIQAGDWVGGLFLRYRPGEAVPSFRKAYGAGVVQRDFGEGNGTDGESAFVGAQEEIT